MLPNQSETFKASLTKHLMALVLHVQACCVYYVRMTWLVGVTTKSQVGWIAKRLLAWLVAVPKCSVNVITRKHTSRQCRS